MVDFLLCGINISCQLNLLKTPKYPPDVAEICYYFEKQNTELPEYCKWSNQSKLIKKRNEF